MIDLDFWYHWNNDTKRY